MDNERIRLIKKDKGGLCSPSQQKEDDPIKIAEHAKVRGNEFYCAGNFNEAIVCYNKAIEMWPNCEQYYGNRCAAYLMSGEIDKALHDANHSIEINPDFTKGHVRAGKCHIEMGQAQLAVASFDRALLHNFCPNIKSQRDAAVLLLGKEQEAYRHYHSREYGMAVGAFDVCLAKVPNCFLYKLMKGECLAHSGKLNKAMEIAITSIERDRLNPDVLYLLGLSNYYQNFSLKAHNFFEDALIVDPKHFKSTLYQSMSENLTRLKEQGNLCYRLSNYQDAISLYTTALEIDPLHRIMNSQLFHNRASCYVKLKRFEAVIEDCSKALNLDNKYIKAYQKRAAAYTELGRLREAIKDCESAWKLDASDENYNSLQDARFRLLGSRAREMTLDRKDYYQILGVTRNATELEIKRAYHKLAKQHHPDRHSNNSAEMQKEGEILFKDVVEAYSILSDPEAKAEYDRRTAFTGVCHSDNLFEMFFGTKTENIATFSAFNTEPSNCSGPNPFAGCKRRCSTENLFDTEFHRNFKGGRHEPFKETYEGREQEQFANFFPHMFKQNYS